MKHLLNGVAIAAALAIAAPVWAQTGAPMTPSSRAPAAASTAAPAPMATKAHSKRVTHRRMARRGKARMANSDSMANQLNAQEQADMAPTEAAIAAYASICQDLARVVASWQRLSTKELAALNAALKSRGRAALALAKGEVKAPSCQ